MTATPSLSNVRPVADDGTAKPQQVQAMFDRIARSYDLLNDCISFGMHRVWKRQACALLQLKPGDAVLDVCSGTGDLIGYLLPHVKQNGQVTALDFSDQMLEMARSRFEDYDNVLFRQGDATQLPYAENAFDGVIVSFGLRNVVDIPRAISEMARVVKPGGWVVNLDTCPEPALPGYWFYFSCVMPVIGRILSMDPTAYRYLAESTRHFLTPAQLKTEFEKAGLVNVSSRTMMMGSVSLQAGRKK